MEENIALVAPAWVWFAAVIALFLFSAAMGALACWALGIRHQLARIAVFEEHAAMRADVERELGAIHQTIERMRRRSQRDTLESPEPDYAA